MSTEPSPRTESPNWLNRWGWVLVIALPIIGAGSGIAYYGQTTDWYFLLPGLPPVERFRAEPESMHPLADALDLPRPPDVSAWPYPEIHPVYEAYGRLRRDPTDADAAGTLGLILEACGDVESGIRAYRRALEIEPGAARWAGHLARAMEDTGRPEEAATVRERWEGNTLPVERGLREELETYRSPGVAEKPMTSQSDAPDE